MYINICINIYTYIFLEPIIIYSVLLLFRVNLLADNQSATLFRFRFNVSVITLISSNVNNMNNDFEAVDWEPVYNTNDVNVALNNFHGVVKTIFDRHAPFIVRRIKGKSCPWMHHDLRKIMTDRDRLLTKARKTKKYRRLEYV